MSNLVSMRSTDGDPVSTALLKARKRSAVTEQRKATWQNHTNGIALPQLSVILAVITLLFGVAFLQIAAVSKESQNGFSHRIDALLGLAEPGNTSTKIWNYTLEDQYLIGVGKADITGPVVEINLNGYADRHQVGTGLRQRLYSRAFIVGSLTEPRDRFVYLVLDVQSGDTAIRYGILNGLQRLGPNYSMYGHDSIAVTGTHSHSGPGGWNNYLLPQIPSLGFNRQSYQAIVDGCVRSIRKAHESLEPGHLQSGSTKLPGAGINRSLFSYLANPEKERAKYNHSSIDDGSVDSEMTMLKFQRASDGLSIGMLNWFPTHGTSMFGNNTLVSGDNKGVAADLFERKVRQEISETDDFVAGFSQANMGDVSPNVLGAWCEDGSGMMCSLEASVCKNGKSQRCHARGPRFVHDDQGAASCFEIGKRQYEGALELYKSLNRDDHAVRGRTVKAVHVFHDMSNFEFTHPNGSKVRTCPAALGYSFAAGTSDGPGTSDFTQHTSNASNTSPVWQVISGFIKKPDQKQINCQHPKPVLLDVGEAYKPYDWSPNIVDIQLFRVGHLVMIVSPGEATTMAGRRWKETVAKESQALFGTELNGVNPKVVLGAPSNTYTHYITTEEEYRIQRYEGASTLYGPHTLAAYIHRSVDLLQALRSASEALGNPRNRGPLPPDNSNRSMSFVPGVIYDGKPWSTRYGDVRSGVDKAIYTAGEIVEATFVGANPRNNLRTEETYAAVEHRTSHEERWRTVRDDTDWNLIYSWKRKSKILGTSDVKIAWKIELETPPGEYRLRYFGDARSITGRLTAFNGTTTSFEVR